MKVRDMIEGLEMMLQDEDVLENTEVLIVTQPNYPLQFEVHSLGVVNNTLYVVAGDHPDSSPYGPRQAWEEYPEFG